MPRKSVLPKLKVITYNIDGLPESLDLNDLPWILKPIAWIYKLIKKTTIVRINDNTNSSEKIKQIGKCLLESDADIIGVQEDFNYHNELISDFYDKYIWGTYAGGFDISKIFSSIKWFPLPHFKADGINLFAKKERFNFIEEKIVKWNKSHGYIGHANDKLTTKGYRYYQLKTDDKYILNVYVLHMDADFYHPENCPDVSKDLEARKSQFNQLVNDILEYYKYSLVHYPTLIIGDTNSYQKYEWDEKNIKDNLIEPIYKSDILTIDEAIADNYKDCDRIFYINSNKAQYSLEASKCYFDLTFDKVMGSLSDHKPLVAEFKLLGK